MQNNETDKAVAKVIESAGRYAPELWADLVASARLGGVLTLLATLAAVVIFTLLTRFCWVRRKDEIHAMAFVGFLLLTLYFLWGVGLCITQVVYPEAAVVKDVMK